MGCTSSTNKSSPKKGKKTTKTSSQPVAITFSSAQSKTPPLVNYDDDSQILSIENVTQLNRDDYGDLIYIQSGACMYLLFI